MDFKILKRDPVYQGRAFNVEKVLLELPDHRQKYYDFIDHNDSVTIFPMDAEGNVYFVSQYRLGAQSHLLELPAGVMEKGEDPEECAMREIQEEIGLAAGNLKPLGNFYLVPGYCNEHMYSFLATDIYPSVLDPDEDEFLKVIKVPYPDVIKKIQAGEVQDVKTLAVIAQAISILGLPI